MGLYQAFKTNDIYISLHHSSFNDAFLYFDISEAITHSAIISSSISETTPAVTCLDDLLDYFALKRIASFSEFLASIEDETNRQTIRNLSDDADKVAKQYSIGAIIKYINIAYESLFGKSEDVETEKLQDIFFPLIEFCIKYQSGINDTVFLFLAEHKWFIYISYYDEVKKKLLVSEVLFDKVFSTNNVLNLIRSRCKELLVIAKSIGESSADEKIKNNINERIFDCVVDIMGKVTERDIIAYSDSIRRIRRYFSEISFDQGKLAQFEEIHDQFEKKLNDWMDKNGSVFSQSIPSDMADKLFNSKAEWITKLLLTTHSYKNGKFTSQFTHTPTQDTPLVDLVSHNIDTDDYFTYSKQQQIQITGCIGSALVLQTFSNEKYLNDITSWFGVVLGAIAEHCKFDAEDLFTDFWAIIQSIQFVDAAKKKQVEGYGESLIYGSCVLVVACIEKLLRLTYKFENQIVLSDELIQLKGLLSNPTISGILTEDLMKGIGFYLSRYGYVGLNYRNRLAHLSDIKINEISNTLPHTFFYLYMCVINSIFIYYCADDKR